ncbi:hypothetical protein [Saccharibacter floricola]|uniref:NHR domain-containing protein n=1 Tax=Saccharibacter floricola DSM 15669 TaxID=1123227 RepID=A0ABQ0NWQ6_9PROT|nr:hypothetical protein [Saccharibacter floricola]GBQ05270.1 hypothetical protein AA15669_0387 [Saccharibacter floricola DSM 15669]
MSNDDKTPFWADEHGQKLTCTEKLRTLRENESELHQVMQDAYEDALLFGVDPLIIKARFEALVKKMESPFCKKGADSATTEDPS